MKVMVTHYDEVMFAGALVLLATRVAGAITSYTHARADLVILRRTALSGLGRGSDLCALSRVGWVLLRDAGQAKPKGKLNRVASELPHLKCKNNAEGCVQGHSRRVKSRHTSGQRWHCRRRCAESVVDCRVFGLFYGLGG